MSKVYQYELILFASHTFLPSPLSHSGISSNTGSLVHSCKQVYSHFGEFAHAILIFFFKTNFRVTTYSRFTCFSCLCDYNIFFLVLRTTNCLLWKPGTQYIISNFTMKYWLNWIEHGIKGAKSVTEGHTELIVEKEMCPDLLIPSQVPGPFLTPYRN